MKFNSQKNLLIALSCIFLSLFFSCSKDDFLNDSEELHATRLVANTTKTITLAPIQDAYLNGNIRYNLPYILLDRNGRNGYLMFDLSQIDGEITSATLEFTISYNSGNGTINAFSGTHSSWTETNLSSQNSPLASRFLGSINKSYSIGNTEKISLNPSFLEKGTKNSLVLRQTRGNDVAFASKEASNLPKLKITYNTGTSSSASKPAVVAKGYYVTVNGRSTNNGLSEGSAWSLEHAFNVAKAGDIIYVKAGNYGNPKLILYNGGISGKPIKFVGYSKSPGDVLSSNGSTFKYRDQVDPNKMPLLKSSQAAKGTAIIQYQDYVEFENFQITGYRTGIQADGDHVVLRNIVATNLGSQGSGSYDGFGLMVTGNNSLIENCYILNAAAEGIKLYGANYSKINYCNIHSDNPQNPTDYYFVITGGTNNAIIENSIADRKQGLSHGGHGFILKDLAEHNIVRNCTAYRTSFELNFSGVRYNTIEDSFIYGVSTASKEWHAAFGIGNGANNNIVKNMYIQDTWAAINLYDTDDGYVGPGGDRDMVSLGYNNTFENLTVKNTERVLNIGGGSKFSADAKNYTFKNCNLSNFTHVAVTYYKTQNFQFQNCKFSYGKKLKAEGGGIYRPYSKFNVKFETCSWTNVQFTPPKI